MMAPKASSSSSAFLKNLPLEPFAELQWHVQQPTSTFPHVVLLINAPRDVAELFRHDPFDEDSLFLIATTSNLSLQDIPQHFPPFVRLLRLNEPVTTALLLASLLDRASTVVRKWNPSEPRLFELVESPEGEFVPASGTANISRRRASVSSLFRTQSSAPKRINRPFDALINFLPETLSEKALLKHTILTTTLSQSFLSSTHNDYGRKQSPHSHASSSVSLASVTSANSIVRGVKRPGSFLRSRDSIKATSASMSRLSTRNVDTTAIPGGSRGRPHLVHVLPRANHIQKNLVSSIEHFLATFSNNASSFTSSSAPSTPPGMGKRHNSLPSPPPLASTTGTVPYLLRPDILFSCPAPYLPLNPSPYSQVQDKTVFHLILGGCLDPTTAYNHPMKSYISSLRDITYEPAVEMLTNGTVSAPADAYPSPPPSSYGLRTPPQQPEPAKTRAQSTHLPHYRLSRTADLARPPVPSRPLSEGSESILGSGLGWYKKPRMSDKGRGKMREVSVSGLPTPPDSSDSSDEGMYPSPLREFHRSRVHADDTASEGAIDRSGEPKRSKLRNRLAFWKR